MSELANLARELAELRDLNEELREIGERIRSPAKPDGLLPIQCKNARAALGWGVRSLADNANISPNNVARFESGEALERTNGRTNAGELRRRGLRPFGRKCTKRQAVATKPG